MTYHIAVRQCGWCKKHRPFHRTERSVLPDIYICKKCLDDTKHCQWYWPRDPDGFEQDDDDSEAEEDEDE